MAAGMTDGRPVAGTLRVSVGQPTRLDGDPVLVVGRSGDALLVDGRPTAARLDRIDDRHARLAGGTDDPDGSTAAILLGPREGRALDGVTVREVVVEGWRFTVEVEPDARASLRERARRGRGGVSAGGPVDVRAIIPGRIVALDVAPGDGVTAGQQLLVLEAMKMQNELRAPRDGTIERVAVAVGATVEVGDLLLVLR